MKKSPFYVEGDKKIRKDKPSCRQVLDFKGDYPVGIFPDPKTLFSLPPLDS